MTISQATSAPRRYSITIEIMVTDEARLYQLAVENAVNSGETRESAEERLLTVQDFIQQVFDPGISPAGTEIENSDVDVLP